MESSDVTIHNRKEAKEDEKDPLEDRVQRLEKAMEGIQGELKAGREFIKE